MIKTIGAIKAVIDRIAGEAQRSIIVVGVCLGDLARNRERSWLHFAVEGDVHGAVVAIQHVFHGARSSIGDTGSKRLSSTSDGSQSARGVARVVDG